jgi:hypothetical protein
MGKEYAVENFPREPNMRRTITLSVFLVVLPAAVALAFPKSGMNASEAASPGAAAAAGAKANDAPQPSFGSGKVVETMNSGGYSYVLIQEKGGEKKWFAVPETKVSIDDDITVQPGVEMQKFSSKTLGKTFDRIVFSPGIAEKGGMAPKPTAAAKAAAATPSAGKVKVEKATGPGAHTVAEIFAKRKSLNGKKVTVRGKVVKISTGIMKRNWIHIQDGTGKKKTNTLVVTSTTLPAEGDTVTVEGILASDRDFGAGYKYDAIVENATVTKK